MLRYSFCYCCCFKLLSPGYVVWCLTLFWGNSQSWFFFKYYLCFLLSSLGITITHDLRVLQLSHSPCIFCSVIFHLWSLCFLISQILLKYSLAQKDYSLMSSLLISLSKVFFISVIDCDFCLSSSISFCSFLGFPSSAYIAHLLLHTVYFSIRVLSILAIILNSKSCNSNILAIFGSVPALCL